MTQPEVTNISVFGTLRQGGQRLFTPSRMRDDIPRRKDTTESVNKNGIFRGQVLKNVVLTRILVGMYQILSIINSKAFPSKSNIFLLGGAVAPPVP